MRKIIAIIILLISNIIYSQDRLTFVKDSAVRSAMQKSIDYLNKSLSIPNQIKNNVVFITLDFNDIYGQEIESFGINYSTQIPTSYSELGKDGQFKTSRQNNILFYNYSKNIVFVFFTGFRYFEVDQMQQLSNQVKITRENLMTSEFFKYDKGTNEFAMDTVQNSIYLEKKNDGFVPVRVNTFDLKTFTEVWYGIDIIEISVGQIEYSRTMKQTLNYKIHVHSGK
ncbi:hypothetical protein [uncultured Chryseobacterium sp.]|uniref:hypothetical protein n=1 Tax=uncultured Chryseobacterium sp. TaxID=259322 RepID=UPI0025F921A5|nr:hypothetical protein [uncultured Chryseobacterium sp.]